MMCGESPDRSGLIGPCGVGGGLVALPEGSRAFLFKCSVKGLQFCWRQVGFFEDAICETLHIVPDFRDERKGGDAAFSPEPGAPSRIGEGGWDFFQGFPVTGEGDEETGIEEVITPGDDGIGRRAASRLAGEMFFFSGIIGIETTAHGMEILKAIDGEVFSPAIWPGNRICRELELPEWFQFVRFAC